MPLYEYQCSKCGNVFEVIQKFSDEPLTIHEGCGGEVVKLISRSAFQLKGSGWYATDYARSPAPKADGGKNESGKGDSSKSESNKGDSGKGESSKSESGKSESGSSDTKSESKTESKSESKSETKSDSKPAPASSKSD